MVQKAFSNHFSFQDATGPIPFGFTNDFMFRAILQQNNNVLKGLICSLLHLDAENINSVIIMNPIELGENIDAKEFILDIRILLNDNTHINLEMQVADELNWSDRSLGYLCRTFDQLCRGQEYSEAKSVIHIGFLDFTPFSDFPEFYATYKLKNIKNGHVYSDKFTLCVVNLTQISLATQEDRLYQIDYWARLFKATTWEEIKMIAKNNEYLSEASQTLYEMNADEIIQEKCYARLRYTQQQNSMNRKMNELTAENERLTARIAELETQLKEKA